MAAVNLTITLQPQPISFVSDKSMPKGKNLWMGTSQAQDNQNQELGDIVRLLQNHFQKNMRTFDAYMVHLRSMMAHFQNGTLMA